MEESGLMDKIVSLCKRRGFVFPGSEIYGGLANSWDYGPLGAELKNNIKNLWWDRFVRRRDDVVGIDAALIMNPKVWEASGHLSNFNDPLVECKECHSRFRLDKLIEEASGLSVKDAYWKYLDAWVKDIEPRFKESRVAIRKELLEAKKKLAKIQIKLLAIVKDVEKLDKIGVAKKKGGVDYDFKGYDNLTSEADELIKIAREGVGAYMERLVANRHVSCLNCGKRDFTHPANFNLMFKTFIGPTEEQANIAYFRPETAQAMFVDFKNVLDTSRRQVPFGIAQVGKAFRNEITPGNFIFRTREFEQMEIEYLIRAEDWEKYFEHWRKEMISWMKEVGIDIKKVHEADIPDGERAHYSKKTIDFEFDFPFGRDELYGLAYRTDFDLKNHFPDKAPYRDSDTGEEFWPHVIEPTWGVDRTLLAMLSSAYTEEGEGDKRRVYLKLPTKLAPYKAAIFPLLRNKLELVAKADEIYKELKKKFMVTWDDRGNIGKRYYSQDEIGTPFCITVDFQTLEDGTVTVRNRDTATQERKLIAELEPFLHHEIYS